MKITGFSQDYSPQESLGVAGVPGGIGAVASDASAAINFRTLVDASDTTADYLGAKLAAGSNITLTTINVGGNEQVRIASTGGSVSYGSNANDVGNADAPGASTLVSRADHVHRGVHEITAAGSNPLYGDVNLVAGANLTLTAAGQTLTLVGTGTGSTSFGSNATDVGNTSAPGATVLSSDAGHVHRGVHLLTSNGSNALYGDVNLVAGAGIALGVSGQNITLVNAGSGGGGGGGGGGTGARYPVQDVSTGNVSSNSYGVTLSSPSASDRYIAIVQNEGSNAVNSITQTNVTWSKLAGTTAGVAPVVEIWVGVPTGAPGTTVTAAMSGSTYGSMDVSEWDSLTGTLDQSATRHSTSPSESAHRVPIITPSNAGALVIAATSRSSYGNYATGFSGPDLMMLPGAGGLGAVFGFPGTKAVMGMITFANAQSTVSSIAISIT